MSSTCIPYFISTVCTYFNAMKQNHAKKLFNDYEDKIFLANFSSFKIFHYLFKYFSGT